MLCFGKIIFTVIILGLKSKDFPKDMSEQNARANDIVKDLLKRVLGRDETFSLTVRKSGQRRVFKETDLIMIPPIEVVVDN